MEDNFACEIRCPLVTSHRGGNLIRLNFELPDSYQVAAKFLQLNLRLMRVENIRPFIERDGRVVTAIAPS